MNLDHLTTEQRNPSSETLDGLSALEIVELMSAEDAVVPKAVAAEAEHIAKAVTRIADRLGRGGRLIYIGAGTSGRLGVLDASECPPTFNTRPEQVVGIIAGGSTALTRAVEGAEDLPEHGARDLQQIQAGPHDVVVGIATSGRTPYVVGALEHARTVGAYAIGLSCNADSELNRVTDLMITPIVGPEILSGSTRLKAGTATKLVLNMLTTGAMVLLGKTYGNLMVDLRATNSKLVERSRRIITQLTGLTLSEAQELLNRCDGEVKTAIVTQRLAISPADARNRLAATGGRLRAALGEFDKPVTRGTAPGQQLIVGVDGGGTKTELWIAAVETTGKWRRVGRGVAGSSNPCAVGTAAACRALDAALTEALRQAQADVSQIQAACFAIAGTGREAEQRALSNYVKSRGMTAPLRFVHDGWAVLAASGERLHEGIALIAGTGSLAFGQRADGSTARVGGWGYLMGDEASGYGIAVEACRAVARAVDGRGPATLLHELLLKHLQLESFGQLVAHVYRPDASRKTMAALAPTVIAASRAGDAVAHDILKGAAHELATMVQTLAKQLQCAPIFRLCLAGGLLVYDPFLRHLLEAQLHARGLEPKVEVVDAPVSGAVNLAFEQLRR